MATGTVKGNLEEKLGWWEYLVEDWKRLRNPDDGFAPLRNQSVHYVMLQASEEYRKAVNWKGPIPNRTDIIPSWARTEN